MPVSCRITQPRMYAYLVAPTVFVMLLVGCGNAATTPPTPQPTATATPVLGVAIPGPRAQFIQNLFVTDRVSTDPQGNTPVTTLRIGAPVYIIFSVHGVPQGEHHTITTYFFLQGQPKSKTNPLDVQDNFNGTASIVYPVAGIGMAKLYWDAPTSDLSAPPSDDYLAQSIAFLIQ